MITIIQHFQNKTTYIMGNYCLNGCQLFHKDESQKVFYDFGVPRQQQKDVMNSFYTELTQDDKLQSNKLNVIKLQIANGIIFDEYINHKNWEVRQMVAKFGTNEMRYKLINDFDSRIRQKIVQYGTDEMQYKLINDPCEYVRCDVVLFGTDEMRQQLIDDPNEWVRSQVANLGNDKIKQQLINDCSVSVRRVIAMTGNYNIKQQLINDSDWLVCEYANNI